VTLISAAMHNACLLLFLIMALYKFLSLSLFIHNYTDKYVLSASS